MRRCHFCAILRNPVVRSRRRHREFPNVPTMVEGVPGYEKPSGWLGIFGPAKLLPAVLARLHGAIAGALTAADVRDKLAASGLDVVANTPEQFAAILRNDTELFRKSSLPRAFSPSEECRRTRG